MTREHVATPAALQPRVKASLWRRRSFEVITSEVVAGHRPGPEAPVEWAAHLRRLVEASRSPVVGPSWWTAESAYFGNVETRTDPKEYHWDGMRRLGPRDRPVVFFQLTLAGWGHFQVYGKAPQIVRPGTGFFAIVPSRHRYYLPEGSAGWTFAWFGIYHPYVIRRIARQVAVSGGLLEASPTSPVVATTMRLVRGAFEKDFRDKFDVELALFEFLLAYERQVEEGRHPAGERARLLEWVREQVLATPRRPVAVEAVAAARGMSRSHFSHHFRASTGLSPAKFMAEVRVQEAARVLLTTTKPLKEIATDWGFANVNHFGKVFRRFHHVSPGTYRKSFS